MEKLIMVLSFCIIVLTIFFLYIWKSTKKGIDNTDVKLRYYVLPALLHEQPKWCEFNDLKAYNAAVINWYDKLYKPLKPKVDYSLLFAYSMPKDRTNVNYKENYIEWYNNLPNSVRKNLIKRELIVKL